MSDAAARWERVQVLLHDALDQPADTRAAWLRTACGDDAALLVEVESLLAAHEGEGLLGRGETAPRLFGVSAEHVGPYRILRPLGRGGMGVVFLAERQTGDVTQLVALKLLPTGLVSSPLVDRFAEERRILARLEHAGIARLIDVGATPDGQPYFAMEFVEGVDLITWAKRRRLTISDRLRLMLAVCSAVEYAHRQLVVHRDLKPSNILVTDDGKPKLLDFGIAKFLEPGPSGAAARATLQWLTPDYASPEQVRGEPMGTGTDVYSLGMLLFELLAEVRPFKLDGLSPAAIEQVICHAPPPRPSERADSRNARRLLRGDLDTIVLKALAKEPERRYDSVRALDEDLRRYLDQQPVRARPDTLAYRTALFARRHRGAVAAVLVVIASLLGGLIAVRRQAKEAERARDRAEQAFRAQQEVSAFLVDMFQSSDPNASADTAMATAIVRRGVQRAEALAAQPLAQARILDALGMVFVGLGQYDTAWVFINRALGQRRAALGSLHVDVAESLRHLARVERARSHYRPAEAALMAALAIQRQAVGVDHDAAIGILDDLAFLMPYLGREDEAVRYRRQALELTREFYPDDIGRIADRTMLLAGMMRRRGAYDDAVRLMGEAIVLRRQVLGPGAVLTADAIVQLGDIVVEMPGGAAPAESLYREGLGLIRAALGDSHLGLVHGLTSLGELFVLSGQAAEAEPQLREALRLRRRALGNSNPLVAESMESLAQALALGGQFAEAERLVRDAHALWLRTVGPEHTAIAGNLVTLADVLARRGRLVEADSSLEQAIAMRVRLFGPGHVLIGVNLSNLGPVQLRLGHLVEAESTMQRALAILRAHQLATHRDVRQAHRRLADIYRAMGRPEEAARHLQQAGG